MSEEDVEDLKSCVDAAFDGLRSDVRKLAEGVKAFGDAIERFRAEMADGSAALRKVMADGFASIGSELTDTHTRIPLANGGARDGVPTG
jgi:hypothetical protein